MTCVKITVLKKEFYPEFADQFLTDGISVGPCPLLHEMDTFIYSGDAIMPVGFCPWAWIDVYKSVSSLSAGASYYPWNNKNGMQIISCTDGIRPVIFKIEAIDT